MVSERGLIEAFLRPFGRVRDRSVLVGAGLSDCAVVQPARGHKLVLKTDAVLEGVHFELGRSAPRDAGHKALAVNLSDLAAAGARPRWFLCALGVPRSADARPVATGIALGMAALAARHGCTLVGGNVTAASQWSITVAALGESRRPVQRSGGKPGDALVVVGRLGDAAAGLGALRTGLPLAGSLLRAAVRAQTRPEPLVREGLALARFASAAVDVSDGFLRDVGHLCEASGCGAEIETTALPLGPAARALPDGLELALTGGEDYALIAAVPPRKLAAVRRAVRCTEVGRLVRGRGLRLLRDGEELPLPERTGYDHLA